MENNRCLYEGSCPAVVQLADGHGTLHRDAEDNQW